MAKISAVIAYETGIFGWGFAGQIAMLLLRMVAGRTLDLRGPDLARGPEVARRWYRWTNCYYIRWPRFEAKKTSRWEVVLLPMFFCQELGTHNAVIEMQSRSHAAKWHQCVVYRPTRFFCVIFLYVKKFDSGQLLNLFAVAFICFDATIKSALRWSPSEAGWPASIEI